MERPAQRAISSIVATPATTAAKATADPAVTGTAALAPPKL
jgi:hypothetical protein